MGSRVCKCCEQFTESVLWYDGSTMEGSCHDIQGGPESLFLLNMDYYRIFFFPYQSVCITTIKGLVMSFVWICLWHDPSIRVAFLISKPCAPFLWVKGSPQRRWWWWGLITWSLDSWKISFLVHVIGPWAKWSLDTPDICYLSIAQRAGLSHLEYPGLKAIDPAYALPVDVVNRIFFGR